VGFREVHVELLLAVGEKLDALPEELDFLLVSDFEAHAG